MEEILIYIVILFLFSIFLVVALSPIFFIIWLTYRIQKKGGAKGTGSTGSDGGGGCGGSGCGGCGGGGGGGGGGCGGGE